MSNPPRSHEMPQDDPGYADAWARDLVAAIGKTEARRILDHYRALSRDPKVTKHGRAAAAERAKALNKVS